MTDLRPVFFVCGILLATLAGVMFVPAIADAAAGNDDWQAFALSSLLTVFVAGALILTNRAENLQLDLRQAFAFTTMSWLIVAAFAALPFAFSSLHLSYTDAFFEAMSGVTTTGSTVISELDKAPPGILLWRAILQWLGGIGIILIALAFLPLLQIGGMQLFRTEAFDTPEKVLPRAAQLAGGIGLVYVLFTALFVGLLWAAGMSGFDAVAHTFAAISTGGFSTRDASIGYFQNPVIDVILIATMIVGSLPFVYYVDLLRGNWRLLARDSQVHVFLAVLGAAVAAVFAWLWLADGLAVGPALLEAGFNVVSIMTGTGLTTTDFSLWGGFPIIVLLALMFVGGCAGSTTCGIKIFRFQVGYAMARTQIARLLRPHGVFIPHYNRQPITDEVATSVMGFFFVFVLCFAALSAGLGLLGFDFLTSISGAATVIGNVGPGFGDIIGPTGNFAPLPDAAKWLLAAGMLLGRLEFFTVLVLFLPSFWRR